MRRKEAGYNLKKQSGTSSRLTREIAQNTLDRASVCHTHGKLACEDPKCNPNAYSTKKDPMFQELSLDEFDK